MKRSHILLFAFVFVSHVLQAQVGKWSISPMGLPRYQYTGQLPVAAG